MSKMDRMTPVLKTQVMAKRKVKSQSVNLTPDH
jgi:hypothetical protein